jgi:hypothetical protein
VLHTARTIVVYGYLPNQRSVLFARKDLDCSKDPVLGLAAMSNPATIEFLAPLFVIVCLKRKTSTCAVTPAAERRLPFLFPLVSIRGRSRCWQSLVAHSLGELDPYQAKLKVEPRK